MKTRQPLKKHLFALCCLIMVSAGAFATDGIIIKDKLVQTFNKAFPNAQQVKWQEEKDMYTVNFYEHSILTKVRYDKAGNFIGSVRYYDGANLPADIQSRLKKNYPDETISVVMEVTSEATLVYYIKLEDAENWTTVKANADDMQIVEQYKKSS